MIEEMNQNDNEDNFLNYLKSGVPNCLVEHKEWRIGQVLNKDKLEVLLTSIER